METESKVVAARAVELLQHLTWGKKWKDVGGNSKQRPPWRPPNGWCGERRRPIRPHCTCRPASASELTRVAPTAGVGDGERAAQRPAPWPSASLYRELRRRHHPHCPLLRHVQDSCRRYLSPSASSSSASSLSSASSASLSGSRSSRSNSSRSQLLLYPWPQPSLEEWRGGMPPLRPRSASVPLDCAFFQVVPADCRDVSCTDGDSQQPDVIPSRHRQPRHRTASDCSYGDTDARSDGEPASVPVPPFALHYPIGSDADTAARQRNPPFRADLARYAFQPPKRAFDNRAGPKTPYALDYPYGSKWDRKNRNRMAPGKIDTKRNKFKSGVVPDVVNNARHRSEKGDRSEKEQDDSSKETATNTNRRREISESRNRTCKLADNKNEPYDYMDHFPWLSPDRPEEYQGNKKTTPTTRKRKELERSRRGRRRADDSDSDESSSRSRSSTSFKACFATVQGVPYRRTQRSRALQPAARTQVGADGSDVGANAQRQSRWGAARRGQGRRGAAQGYNMFDRRHRHKNYKERPGYEVSVSQVEKEMFVYTYPTDTAPKTGPSFVAAPAGGSTVVPLHNCLEISPCTYNRYHQQGWAWRPPAVMALTHLATGEKQEASPSPSRPRKQSRARPRTRSRAPPRHASPERATSVK